MQLISDEYRAQQKHLHATTVYGTASIGYAPKVAELMNKFQIAEVLDYGAGRLNLLRTISDGKLVHHPFKYIPYEPANEEYADTPEPAEMVACIDVLEHIEPDLLDNVLDDLARVTQWVGFFTVDCGPAKKVLPDGRNAHLIQQPPDWWLPKIMERFDLHMFQKTPGGFMVLVANKGQQ